MHIVTSIAERRAAFQGKIGAEAEQYRHQMELRALDALANAVKGVTAAALAGPKQDHDGALEAIGYAIVELVAYAEAVQATTALNKGINRASATLVERALLLQGGE